MKVGKEVKFEQKRMITKSKIVKNVYTGNEVNFLNKINRNKQSKVKRERKGEREIEREIEEERERSS